MMTSARRRLLISASPLSVALIATSAFGQTTPPNAPAQTQPAQTQPPSPAAATPPNPAPEQTSATAAAAPQSGQAADATTTADVVVTGFRSSLQKAIDLKRQAIGVRDSIVAEDIGKFPEQNVAESLQRIPGVILQRDGPSNEGQKISLRGLGSNYVVTTINGAPVRVTTSADVGASARNFNYDVFPSELFGRVDVYKTPLANLEEGGIAGNVDLQTPRPFDTPGRVIRYTASGQYNTTSKKVNPRGSLLISDTSGDFGALIGVAYAKNENLRSGFQTTGLAYNTSRLGRIGFDDKRPQGTPIGPYRFEFDYASPRANLGSYSLAQVDNAYFPRFFRAFGGNNTRERLGGTASLQYKTDRLEISLDGIYADITDENDTYTFGVPVRETRTTNRSALPGRSGNSGLIPLNPIIDNDNNLYGTFGNANLFNEAFYYDAKTKFYYGILRGSWKANDYLTINAQTNYSKSRGEYFQNRILTNIYGVDVTFDPSKDRIYPTISTPVDYTSPSSFALAGKSDPTILLQRDVEEDEQKNARLVLEYAPDDVDSVTWRARLGGSYVSTLKRTYRTRLERGFGLVFPNEDLFANMVSGLPIGSIPDGGNQAFPSSWATFTRDYAVDHLDSREYTKKFTIVDAAANFDATENVASLFFEADARAEVAGHQLRTNVGMRYSNTKTIINNAVDKDLKGGYTYWLPSMSLALDLTDKVIVRSSLGRTITRAALTNIARATNIPTSTLASAVTGNPALRPQLSTSFDTGVEWYFAPGGLLSVGAFKKILRDSAVSDVIFGVPFGTLGLPAAALSERIFYPGQAAPDPNQPINVTTLRNGGVPQVFRGLEIAYQQSFTFLPAPFDGLGVLSSFTKIFPRELFFPSNDGKLVPVSSIPKTSYSVTGYFEKGPFAIRASWNYRDRTSGSTTNSGTNLITWTAARGFLDATASYKINDAVELRVDALNLTNSLSWLYYEDPAGRAGNGASRPQDALYSGRTIAFGIRGKF